MIPQPEQQTSEQIDQLLTRAGWAVSAAAQVLREFMREYVAQYDSKGLDTDEDSEGVALERTGTGNRQG